MDVPRGAVPHKDHRDGLRAAGDPHGGCVLPDAGAAILLKRDSSGLLKKWRMIQRGGKSCWSEVRKRKREGGNVVGVEKCGAVGATVDRTQLNDWNIPSAAYFPLEK